MVTSSSHKNSWSCSNEFNLLWVTSSLQSQYKTDIFFPLHKVDQFSSVFSFLINYVSHLIFSIDIASPSMTFTSFFCRKCLLAGFTYWLYYFTLLTYICDALDKKPLVIDFYNSQMDIINQMLCDSSYQATCDSWVDVVFTFILDLAAVNPKTILKYDKKNYFDSRQNFSKNLQPIWRILT